MSASPPNLAILNAAVAADPSLEVTIDLQSMTASWKSGSIVVSMPETAREALITGRWDAVAELMGNEEVVDKVAASLPYVQMN